MGKYNKFERRVQVKERPYRIHPIWRGIGCILMLVIPIVSYAGAYLVLQLNDTQYHWYPVPYELAQIISIPYVNITLPITYIQIIMTVLVALLGYGVLVILYMIIYSITGPGPSPVDAPPVRSRPKRRRAY